jgi:hypothetical protein
MGKKDAKDFASTKHKGLPEKVKEENYTVNKKPVSKDTYDATMKAAGKQPSPEKVKEELKGGQVKLDKNKNGKLDSQDFINFINDIKSDASKVLSYRKINGKIEITWIRSTTSLTSKELSDYIKNIKLFGNELGIEFEDFNINKNYGV